MTRPSVQSSNLPARKGDAHHSTLGKHRDNFLRSQDTLGKAPAARPPLPSLSIGLPVWSPLPGIFDPY